MQRYAFASQFSQEASARNHCFPVERDFCFYGIARNWFIAGYECQIYVFQSVKSSRWLWCKPSESMKRTLGNIARLRRRELHSRLPAPYCL